MQRLLGHAGIHTTMQYDHLAPGLLEQDISKIDEILSSEENSIDAVPECVEGVAV